MIKLKVQAQYLQPGDIVGSGEMCAGVTLSSISWPSNKVCVRLINPYGRDRSVLWGKYTMINIERKEKAE